MCSRIKSRPRHRCLWVLVATFQGQLVGFVQGLVGWNFHAGYDAHAFPIGLCNGIDRLGIGHRHLEILVDGKVGDGVGTAAVFAKVADEDIGIGYEGDGRCGWRLTCRVS